MNDHTIYIVLIQMNILNCQYLYQKVETLYYRIWDILIHTYLYFKFGCKITNKFCTFASSFGTMFGGEKLFIKRTHCIHYVFS